MNSWGKYPLQCGTLVAGWTILLAMFASLGMLLNNALWSSLPGTTYSQSHITLVWQSADGSYRNTSRRTFLAADEALSTVNLTFARHSLATVVGRAGSLNRAPLLIVESNFFTTLGVIFAVPPVADLHAMQSLRGVVISESLWLGSFGGDASILNRSITVGGQTYPILAVANASFRKMLGYSPELWVIDPYFTRWSTNNPDVTDADERLFSDSVPDGTLLGTLRDRYSLSDARAELAAVNETISKAESDSPDWLTFDSSDKRLVIFPGIIRSPSEREFVSQQLGALLFIASVFASVVITSTFIFFDAQFAVRRQELLVRITCGAQRWHIFLLVFRMSLQILVPAVLLSTVLVGVINGFITSFEPFASYFSENIPLNWRLWGISTAIVSGGLAVVAAFSAQALASGLSDGANKSLYEMRGKSTLRRHLVALSTAGVVLASLAVGGWYHLRNLENSDLGFNLDSMSIMELQVPVGPQPRLDTLLRLPETVFGSRSSDIATVAQHYPFDSHLEFSTFATSFASNDVALVNAVDDAFFRSFGISTLRGDADLRRGQVAINRSLYEKHLARGIDLLSSRITFQLNGTTLTGVVNAVVGDMRYLGKDVAPTPTIYLNIEYSGSFTSRIAVGGETNVDTLQQAVRDAPGGFTVTSVTPLREILLESLRGLRSVTLLSTLLVLGSVSTIVVGIASRLIAHTSRHRFVFGMHRAVGATGRDIILLVMGRASWAFVQGAIYAVPIVFVASYVLRQYAITLPVGVAYLLSVVIFYGVIAAAAIPAALSACRIPPRELLTDN